MGGKRKAKKGKSSTAAGASTGSVAGDKKTEGSQGDASLQAYSSNEAPGESPRVSVSHRFFSQLIILSCN